MEILFDVAGVELCEKFMAKLIDTVLAQEENMEVSISSQFRPALRNFPCEAKKGRHS